LALVVLVVVAYFAFKIYFYPTQVAKLREHGNTQAIFIVNLFFGWTLLGWVIALVWANLASNGKANGIGL
jgi:hypothetical protein